jgi:predicted CXXCH cytochrome family protein
VKKILTVLLALAVAAAAGQVYAGIAGSKHDFRGSTWYGAQTQICVPCHTPHGANTTVKPLWNHAMGTNNYTNNLTTVFGTTWGSVNGPSLLCLSCHDGTVALDSYGGATGTNYIPAASKIGDGSTLNGNHPISINYTATLVTSGQLNNETTVKNSGIYLYGAGSPGIVECGSCHDVHNGANIAGLLRITNAGSQLCLTCHIK